MSKPASFKENGFGATWKGNNLHANRFSQLFNERNKLFDQKKSYPAPKKGLVFPDVSIALAGGKYSFKTTDVADKFAWKDGALQFQARYKKGSDKWDLSVADKVTDEISYLAKYEERGTITPSYIFGLDFGQGPIAMNMKMNPMSGVCKMSAMYNMNDILKSAKIAADAKVSMKCDVIGYNVGASYESPAGLTVAALTHEKMMVISHSMKVLDDTTAGLEITQNMSGGGNTAQVAICHKLDKKHQLKARANNDGHLNVVLQKDLSSSLSLLASGVWDMHQPDSMARMPTFGFKIVTK